MPIIKDAEASHLLKAMEKSVNQMLENQMQMKLAVDKILRTAVPPVLTAKLPPWVNDKSGGVTVVDRKQAEELGIIPQDFVSEILSKLDKIIKWLPGIGNHV